MGKNILICDDAAFMRMMIKDILTKNGYNVAGEAENGLKAIEKYNEVKPDLVMMDITMPEMDGINAIAEIQKLNLKTRIIVLTAYDDADLIYRAMKVGACGYVLKTMVSAQLIKALDEVSMGKIYLPTVLCSKFFEYFQEFEKNGQINKEDENDTRFVEVKDERLIPINPSLFETTLFKYQDLTLY